MRLAEPYLVARLDPRSEVIDATAFAWKTSTAREHPGSASCQKKPDPGWKYGAVSSKAFSCKGFIARSGQASSLPMQSVAEIERQRSKAPFQSGQRRNASER